MDKLIGKIYRIHRKKAKISLAKLASQVNITKNKLSNFENGRVSVDDDTIKKLYECIGMKYVNSTDHQLIVELFETFIQNYLSYEPCDEVYNKILSMKDELQSSVHYPMLMLVEYTYNIFFYNEFYDYVNLAKIINENIELYDNKGKQIFFDMTGLYFVYRKDYVRASECFEKALSYGNEPINALVLFHKALLCLKQRNYLESLLIFNRSTGIFDQYLIYKRSLLNQAFKALIYTRFQSFELAVNLYKLAIENMESIGMMIEATFFKNELT